MLTFFVRAELQREGPSSEATTASVFWQPIRCLRVGKGDAAEFREKGAGVWIG